MQKQRILLVDTGDNKYTGGFTWVYKDNLTPDQWRQRLKDYNDNPPSTNYFDPCTDPTLGYEVFGSSRPKGRYMSDCVHSKSNYIDWHTSDLQFWGSAHYVAVRSRFRATNWFLGYRNKAYLEVPREYIGMIPPPDFSARAWHSMQPRFEGEISMLNFLYELKDLKPLIKYISKFNFKRLLRDMRKVLGSVRTDPSKPLAEAHLANEFAIKPMLSDIGTIIAQIASTVESAQKRFTEAGSEFQKSHYSEENILVQNDEYNCMNFDSFSSNLWRVTGDVRAKYTATMRYKYKYTQRPTWQAFIKYWGLDLSAEALWNAIPFSFVIDYFIKIGDSLHASSHDLNVAMLDYEYAESTRIQSFSGIVVRPSTKVPYVLVNNKPFLGGQSPLSGYSGEWYNRIVTTPNKGIALPRVATALSVGKLTNMAALIRCFL